MKCPDNIRLLDMLCKARRVEKSTRGVKLEDFLQDMDLQDIVLRNNQIIGEAAARVSEERKKQSPEIPWMEIVGTRNVVGHEYDGVDLYVIWDIVRVHIPELIEKIDAILNQESEE